MGRWAQRRRGSGGGGPNVAPLRMTTAIITGPLQVTVTYSGNVDSSLLDLTDYASDASGQVGDTAIQLAPDSFEISFTGDVSLDTNLTYSGSATDLLSPDTIFYT